MLAQGNCHDPSRKGPKFVTIYGNHTRTLLINKHNNITCVTIQIKRTAVQGVHTSLLTTPA